jgi:hypothetical protein
VKASAEIYGAPGRMMIEKISAAIHEDEAAFRATLTKKMRYFIARVSPDASGVSIRHAQRFALTYAAGSLAAKWGVLHWSRKLIFEDIAACYYAARRGLAGAIDPIGQELNRIVSSIVNAERIADIDGLKADEGEAASLDEADGFHLTDRSGRHITAVRKSIMRDKICARQIFRAALQRLADNGVLVKGAKNIFTRQLEIPGVHGRRRYYVFIRDRLQQEKKRIRLLSFV